MPSFHRVTFGMAAALLVIGCSQPPLARDESAPPTNAGTVGSGGAPAAIVDRDWELVAFGDGEPIGATDRPVTLRLDAATGRASGYAGCNGYGGAYTLRGDSLSFGPAAMTRKACERGMDTEQRYASMLPMVSTYESRASTLTLRGASGVLATFRSR